ncbi:MAG: YlxR family protein [Clostridia bacterium]|nr:YlxR family protein [Clostridia bacterium]
MRFLKNIPQRTCIGCNEVKNKNDLIRIVKDKEGNIFVDKTGKANGRGAYICNNIECLEKMIKTKKLERTFEVTISPEIYEKLRGEM